MTDHSHILIFSIGPVQSFIAEARRTVDLYAGSCMLAEVAYAVAQSLVQNGGQLIYPVLNSQEKGETADTPNIIVALVNNPQADAEQAQEKALARWRKFADDAWQNLEDRDDSKLQAIWQRQRDNFLEFYWVATPYDPTPDKYPESYKFISAAHTARKRTRLFEAVEEDSLKDSLSGSRSALRTSKDKDAREYWQCVRANKTSAEVQEGELLDAIGAMKRFIFEQPFPSTSTVASTSFVKECNRELLAELLERIEVVNEKIRSIPQNISFKDGTEVARQRFQENHLRKIKNFADPIFPYGGDLLYVEGWAKKRWVENYGISDEVYEQVVQEIESAKETLRKLYRNSKAPLSPYYAILHMDGDQMGKHVSMCQTLKKHQQLSATLSKFAQEAKGIVKKHNGYLVYAGGDDVLAFFPADTALTAADTLARAYQDKFKDWAQKDEDGNDLPFTASAGIAFAHYLYPLDAVLAAARQAEKRAKNKNTYNRHAICITVLRRSGETLDVGGKWQFRSSQIELRTVGIVNDLKQLLDSEQLSSRFAYSVFRDAPVVTAMSDKSARKTILRQLIKQHKSEKVADKKAETLLETWTAWANAHDRWLPQNQGFLELARWFVLARWLAGGGKE